MIFVDSSFFYAGVVKPDRHHDSAVLLSAKVDATRLVTTNNVRGEMWTLLRRREGHRVAVNFLDNLERTGRVQVEHITEELEREALDWLRLHDEREYSFVDATSFAYMRANGLTEALAFDGDFAAAGFVELRP